MNPLAQKLKAWPPFTFKKIWNMNATLELMTWQNKREDVGEVLEEKSNGVNYMVKQ